MKRAAVFAALVLLLAIAPSAHADSANVDCSATTLANDINIANGNPGPDVLHLASGCVYVFTTNFAGNDALPVVTDTAGLTIDGNGATVLRNSTGVFRILEVASGALMTITNLTIQGGRAPDGSSGGSPGLGGGGILNAGKLTLKHVTVAGNVAGKGGDAIGPMPGGLGGFGGGISNVIGSTLIVSGSRFVSNTAGDGGSGTPPGAAGAGGAIDNHGTLRISKSTFRFNSGGSSGVTGGLGGAIKNELGSTVTLVDSKISSNSAGSGTPAGTGGGIFNNGVKINAKRTTIKNNSPDNCAPSGTVRHCSN